MNAGKEIRYSVCKDGEIVDHEEHEDLPFDRAIAIAAKMKREDSRHAITVLLTETSQWAGGEFVTSCQYCFGKDREIPCPRCKGTHFERRRRVAHAGLSEEAGPATKRDHELYLASQGMLV